MLACATLSATRPAWADYSNTVMGLGPVAYYRLNETAPVPAADVATNSGTGGQIGTGYYVNTPLHEQPGALAGNSDTAVAFDGLGQRMQIPFDAAVNPLGPFTVEAWVNPAVAPPPAAQSSLAAVLSYGHLADPRSGWLLYQAAGGWNLRMYNHVGLGTALTITGGAAPVAGTWYHVVAVYDGTNGYVYANGALGAQAAAPGYYPNTDSVFSVGTRSDVGFHYNGSVDEVALYTNALTAAEILAHYQNGTNVARSTPYDTLVKSSNPLLYFRLNEPSYTPPDPSTLPYAANSGTLDLAARGTNYPGIKTGAAGPPFTGFGANNYAYRLNGFAGNVGLGNPDGLNFVGQISFMVWIKPQAVDGLHNIFSHGYVTPPNQELYMRIYNGAYEAGSWETGAGVRTPEGMATADIGQWVHLTGTYDGTTWKLYRNTILVGSAVGGGWTAMPADWSIGSRGDTSADQRYFGGTMDEPVIFDRALTQAEIQQAFWAGNVPPIITQPPQAPAGQILAGAPVSVPVVAVGTPTLNYQWTKNGNNAPGQTTATLTFGNITTNDAGNYAVVVTNTYGAVTSSIAALTVIYPTNPAALASASGWPAYNPTAHTATLTEVTLDFTGPLGPSGGIAGNYAIPGLTVSNARFTNLNLTVILTTSPHTDGALYTVTVTGVTDGVGRPVTQNTAQFRAWVASPANGVLFEHYYYNEGTTVAALTEDPLFPAHSALATNLWVFDSRAVFPDDTHEQYGARMSGVFVPPASGNWRFFLRSDDASRVYFNPNGPAPAGKQLILEETGCCGDWNKALAYTNPAAIPLVAGQPYYIEMLYKEGGGGDYGKVAARLDGTGYPTLGTGNGVVDPAGLNGPTIGYPYAPANVGGALSVTGPTSVNVAANHTVTFTVNASNSSALPMFYQWRRNGANIDGATSSSYSFVATPTDNNARFTVQVAKLGSVVVSSEALLTVNSETDAPAVVSVRGSEFLNQVVVSFSELMGTPTPTSYTVPGFTTTGAALDATGTNVAVTLNNPLTPGQTYNLTVQNVPDSVGTILTSATVPFRAFVFSRGLLKYEYFPRLSTSVNALDTTLLPDPRFPNSPDWTAFVTAFDSRTIFPDDLHNGYGAHISGLFIPAASGNYAFFLRSDDTSRFFLNPAGPNPMDLLSTPPLLEELTCCRSFSAIGGTNGPMVAGQMYRVEAIYKEGGGGDYLQVASKLETDPAPPDSLSPIPGQQLGLLADPAGASVTITQQPQNYLAVYRGAEAPQTILDQNFNANNGGFSVVNYAGPGGLLPPGPWAYDAVRGSWSCHGEDCPPYDGPYVSSLNTPSLTLTNGGGVLLTFAHRYSFEGYNPGDGTAWDGGQVRLSINGGPFRTVPAANFTAEPPFHEIGGSLNTNLPATPGWVNVAWVGESANYASGAYLTSVANLGYFNPGDTITVQFVTSWDDGCQGTPPNWEIDNTQITVGVAVPVAISFQVGAESTYQGQPNPYLAYFWQRDIGTGFQDIPGASSPTCVQNVGLADSGTRFRCIVYSPGASATSDVATVTVTVPLSVVPTAPNTLTLSWPLPPPPLPVTTFLLEKTATLAPAAWSTVPSSTYLTTATKVYTTVTPTNSSVFYRLHRN